jgi:4'-phosphopantetheinyl transferase
MESPSPIACPWCSPSEFPTLAEPVVHVWCVALEVPEGTVDALLGLLSPEERQQADRLRTEGLRRRFVVRRARLRQLLARYLGAEPPAVRFDRGAYGKPALAAPWIASRLHFSTSHSGELGLVAIAIDRVLGIDVERMRPLSDFEDLSRNYFASSENETLRRLPEAERLAAFYRGWVRKESILKALGTGLSLGLDQVVVSLDPDAARLLAIQGSLESAAAWQLEDLQPAPGFAAALARPAGDCCVECFRCS